MKKQNLIVGIIVLLVCVRFSGCLDDNKSYCPVGYIHSNELSLQYNRAHSIYDPEIGSIAIGGFYGYSICKSVNNNSVRIYNLGSTAKPPSEIEPVYLFSKTIDNNGVIAEEGWNYNLTLTNLHYQIYGQTNNCEEIIIYSGETNDNKTEIREYTANECWEEYIILSHLGYYDGTEFHLYGW